MRSCRVFRVVTRRSKPVSAATRSSWLKASSLRVEASGQRLLKVWKVRPFPPEAAYDFDSRMITALAGKPLSQLLDRGLGHAG
jgi:hypothetical protein